MWGQVSTTDSPIWSAVTGLFASELLHSLRRVIPDSVEAGNAASGRDCFERGEHLSCCDVVRCRLEKQFLRATAVIVLLSLSLNLYISLFIYLNRNTTLLTS